MKRLAATAISDVRLQWRSGFYYAAGFVAGFWILVLSRFEPGDLAWFMPLFVLSNLMLNTFYFSAGLVLLEKGEGTLTAQVVTPLRDWEYLASKVVTLTLLTLAENFLIVLLGFGTRFDALGLACGIVSCSVLLTLNGFLFVSRYDSINEFLFPSALYSMVMVPPFLFYLGILESPLLYLHPLQAPLVLTQAAFQPVAAWQWLYGLLYSALWAVLLLVWSRRVFARFIVTAEGVRA